MQIREAGLLFGEFDESDCFHIEESKIYSRLKGKGYKSVEFVLRLPDRNELLFVEGKTSLPSEQNVERFHEEIDNISQKFMDSVLLTTGIWFGEHSKAGAPSNADAFFTYGTQIVFTLVIKNRTWDGLSYIAECIMKKLRREHRLMRFKVLVLREEDAIKRKLVIGDAAR